jgi:outer membrane protein TolC
MKVRSCLVLVLLSATNWMPVNAQESLSLFQAIETGLKNNYSIIIQKNYAQIASNDNTLGNAGFLPQVNLTGTQNNTFTSTHQEMFNGTVKDIDNAKNRSMNAGVQLTWTLFDGLSMFASKDMLEILEGTGRTEVRIAMENTVSAMVLTYFGVIQQQKLIVVMQDALNLSKERRDITRAKIDLGAGSEMQLLQATVDMNTDSINLILEISALKQTRADLNRLMALDPASSFILTDSITLNGPLSFDQLLATALIQNNDLLIARNNLDISTLELKDARSQRYPRLNFNAGYSYNQINSQTGFAEYSHNLGPSVGFSLSYPIFDGLNVNRTVNNAKLTINTRENLVKDTELSLANDLYKLYTDYLTQLEIVQIERINQDVAKKNLDVAFEKYRLGTINDIDLREIQKKYIDAQYQLLLSQFLAKKAETDLLRITGELGKMF